jgi:2-desacetyl-2-hydroxyethyl bacteriochlorophyllide A dehydrogenase
MGNLRCVVTGPRRVELVTEEPRSALAPQEIRIRTIYSLISPGTELAMYNGTHIGLNDPNITFAKYPFYPGYAAVGEVTEIGPGVASLTRGARVFFAGGHASESIVPAGSADLAPLPEGLEPKLAPFARLAQISYTAPFVAGNIRGRDVAIIGLGLIGNLAAQLCKHAGAHVFAFDTLPQRCKWARSCGVEHAFPVEGDIYESVQSAMGAGRPSIIIEATGIAAVVPICLRLVAERGAVILLGSPRQIVEMDIYSLIHRTGVRLVGAHERVIPDISADSANKREVTRAMLQAVENETVVVRPLISRIASPHEIGDCYQALDAEKDKAIGVLLQWDE